MHSLVSRKAEALRRLDVAPWRFEVYFCGRISQVSVGADGTKISSWLWESGGL